MERRLTLIAAVLLLLFLSAACVRPDEDIENVLIGTWKHMNYNSGDWEKITFREDMSYRLVTYDGSLYTTNILSGTYRFTEEQFIFEQRYGNDFAFSYTVSGDSLITMNKVYLRQ